MIVLKQISALGELILGDRHPLRRLCGWLASTKPSQIDEIVFRGLKAFEIHFGSALGPMHKSTLRLHCDCIRFRAYEGKNDEQWVD